MFMCVCVCACEFELNYSCFYGGILTGTRERDYIYVCFGVCVFVCPISNKVTLKLKS